jgi:type VI secretion system protein ImpJ
MDASYKDIEARDIPESIRWHEGLLLTPQHFQQMSLRHESLLQYFAGSMAPFGWGVRHFKWDTAGLSSGVLSVLHLDAVMPDGLVVSFDTPRSGELSIDLKKEEVVMKAGESRLVHLAVEARGSEGRYDSVEGMPVADEHKDNGDMLIIPRQRPRLKLLGAEPGKSHTSFPLARVTYTGSTFTLDGAHDDTRDHFIPPRLMVERESVLGRRCSAMATLIRDRAHMLAARLRPTEGDARAAFDIETESLIRRLVAPLPQLEAVLFTGVSHPFLVYLAFCATAGQLATIDGNFDPPIFPPYNHDDLAATFGFVLDYIGDKLDAGASFSFSIRTFRYDELDGIYKIRFKREWAEQRPVLGMRAMPGMTETETTRWGLECVIGSKSCMDSLRRMRVSGAPRALIERDEDLVPPRDVVLFALSPDKEYVVPGEELQIFNAGERGKRLRPQEIVLYVREKRSGAGQGARVKA